MAKYGTDFLGAIVLMALSGVAAHADGGIQREVLSTCYVAPAPVLRDSETGNPGDSNDTNNPCDTGAYAAQSLVYSYQTRQTVLLIIPNLTGPATTQTVTETTPTLSTYYQNAGCEDQATFAAEALAYFQDLAAHQLQPLCGP